MLLKELRKGNRNCIESPKRKIDSSYYGQFQCKGQRDRIMCITPSGMEYDRLTAADIVIMDVNGEGNMRG